MHVSVDANASLFLCNKAFQLDDDIAIFYDSQGSVTNVYYPQQELSRACDGFFINSFAGILTSSITRTSSTAIDFTFYCYARSDFDPVEASISALITISFPTPSLYSLKIHGTRQFLSNGSPETNIRTSDGWTLPVSSGEPEAFEHEWILSGSSAQVHLNLTPLSITVPAFGRLSGRIEVGCGIPLGWAIDTGIGQIPYKASKADEYRPSASGPSLGRIPRHKRCVLSDIRTSAAFALAVFKNEESGINKNNDFFVDPNAIGPLTALASSVRAAFDGQYWLRVTDAFDTGEDPHRGRMHFEGRALDLTLTDTPQRPGDAPSTEARALYGCLAQMAHDAGFSWALYENAEHVHASVRSSFVDMGEILEQECDTRPWTVILVPELQIMDCSMKPVSIEQIQVYPDKSGLFCSLISLGSRAKGPFTVADGAVTRLFAGDVECYVPVTGKFERTSVRLQASWNGSSYEGTYVGPEQSGRVLVMR